MGGTWGTALGAEAAGGSVMGPKPWLTPVRGPRVGSEGSQKERERGSCCHCGAAREGGLSSGLGKSQKCPHLSEPQGADSIRVQSWHMAGALGATKFAGRRDGNPVPKCYSKGAISLASRVPTSLSACVKAAREELGDGAPSCNQATLS